MPSMEKNLDKFIQEAEKEIEAGDVPVKLFMDAMEEASLDEMSFVDNTVKSEEWELINQKMKGVMAVSLVNCGLEKLEEPKTESNMEVLDISFNPKLDSVDFVRGFPKLVSLTLHGLPLLGSQPLEKAFGEILKNASSSIKVIEADDTMLFGHKDQATLRDAVFELFPDLFGFNGHDKLGNVLEELEEEDYLGEGELPFDDEEEESGDEEEESGDEEKEEDAEIEEEDAEAEPESKRAKKE